jgi:hypothetical protein
MIIMDVILLSPGRKYPVLAGQEMAGGKEGA